MIPLGIALIISGSILLLKSKSYRLRADNELDDKLRQVLYDAAQKRKIQGSLSMGIGLLVTAIGILILLDVFYC